MSCLAVLIREIRNFQSRIQVYTYAPEHVADSAKAENFAALAARTPHRPMLSC